MDLISREAARTAVYGYEMQTGIAEMPLEFAHNKIDKVPSVSAVPLDKLCEWLDKNNDFVPFCADDKADCNSCELEGAECIKKRIMLWMEGLDAAD